MDMGPVIEVFVKIAHAQKIMQSEENKKPSYTIIDGLICPPSFIPEVLRDACNYRPSEEEVVVATYPKCGTTWTLQIVVTLLRRGQPPATTDEYFRSMPFLEMTPIKLLKKMSKPGCIKTHLPFDRITYSPDAKYIYVARHPADCLVSYFHHICFFPAYEFSVGNFDTYFDLFLKGESEFNDYFDHLLSWYEQRNLSNVLFLTYESMKKDHKGSILKIARFLEDGLYDELVADDEAMLKKVLYYTSLDYMKLAVNDFWREAFAGPPPAEIQEQNSVMKKYAELLEEANKKGFETKGEFIRKGEVGEGKITLSEEQMERLNKRILEKTANSDVMDLWKDT